MAETIAIRMKKAMQLRSISQSDLVRVTGIGKSSISTYLSGQYEPKQKNIYKIAKALNVSEPWLMGLDVPMMRNEDVQTFPNGFMPVPKTVRKPRLGVISCGIPIDNPENFDGYDEVPEHINCDFTLICHGDSMMNARIYDGDLVYIKQQTMVENGQIAAVLVDGTEKLLKRVYMTEDSIALQAENPNYAPMIYTKEDMNRVSIIGKAVGFTSVIK